VGGQVEGFGVAAIPGECLTRMQQTGADGVVVAAGANALVAATTPPARLFGLRTTAPAGHLQDRITMEPDLATSAAGD